MEKIYVNGVSIKPSKDKFGTHQVSFCYEDFIKFMNANKEHFTESKNGKHYLNTDMFEKKEVGQYGDTHYLKVNTWKPEQTTGEATTEATGEGVPEAVQQTFPDSNEIKPDELDDIPF